MNDTKRPTVLITGASGLLGWSLQRQFSSEFNILAPDLDEFDILRRDETIEYIETARPNVIIHAAAYTAVDRAEEEPEAALALNGGGAETVAEGARRAEACLIYISTDYVFDGLKGAPYVETDEPNPLGSYGRSKLAGEEAVRRILDHYMIVRTAWIFGPGRPNFVKTMAGRAFRGERSKVVNDQTGSPTYTPHLASAIHGLYRQRRKGIINVANRGVCTWYDLTRETYRLAGAPTELVEPISTADLGRPAPRPAYSALDTSRLRRIVGEELPTWQEGLAAYFRDRESWKG